MRKKIVLVSVLMVILMVIFFDIYMRIEYDNGLLSYFEKSHTLTLEERQWLIDHGPIIYGADQNAPPLRYHDLDSGQFKGIVVDYLRALSIELGVEIEFEPLVWEEALGSLKKGDTDICDMYPSDERRALYLFTDTIYNQKSIIVTQSENLEIQTLKDLNKLTIAVQKGDYARDFLRAKGEDIRFVYTDDYRESIQLLLDSEVDAIVGDEPVVSYFLDELNVKDRCRTVEEPLFELESILAVNRSEPMLVSILNKGIYNLKRKGTMEKIYQKWYGISAPFIKEKYPEKVLLFSLVISVILILFGYLFYSWNRLLVNEVDKRTRELNKSKKNLQTTFDSLSHLMVVMDREDGIVHGNKAFKEQYGDDDAFMAQEAVLEVMEKTFECGKGSHAELMYGSTLYELETYPMERHEEQVYRILLMAKDVTRVRVTEQRLLQSNKMTAVGQLAAGVAHEIRNPLGTIRNFAYILKNDLTKDEAKRDQSLEIIVNSVEKAGKIIDNLLNFSSISGDTYEKTKICEFIENILSLEHKLMNRQNIDAVLKCDPSLICVTNQESMKHILINLISNAVDAMPDGGQLQIRCWQKEKTMALECADTGIGMDKTQIENIFNPFYTTKQRIGGTGLGMYLTYHEVQKLEGAIEVESVLGEGTCITVTLPLTGKGRER